MAELFRSLPHKPVVNRLRTYTTNSRYIRFGYALHLNYFIEPLDLWVVGLVRIFLIYHDFKLNVYHLNIHKVDIKINIMFNSLCNFNGVVYERIRKSHTDRW